jgi:hypothetical protein
LRKSLSDREHNRQSGLSPDRAPSGRNNGAGAPQKWGESKTAGDNACIAE